MYFLFLLEVFTVCGGFGNFVMKNFAISCHNFTLVLIVELLFENLPKDFQDKYSLDVSFVIKFFNSLHQISNQL